MLPFAFIISALPFILIFLTPYFYYAWSYLLSYIPYVGITLIVLTNLLYIVIALN